MFSHHQPMPFEEEEAIKTRSEITIEPLFGNESGILSEDRLGGGRYVQKAPPWKRRETVELTGKIRVRLPGLENFDHTVAFVPKCNPRVLLRLEKLMGTDVVKLIDFKYLRTLAHKIEEREQLKFLKRLEGRQDVELSRYRNLVLRGQIEPNPDEVGDLVKNPIFRVNEIMRHLRQADSIDSKFRYERPSKTMTDIEPVEPFEEYEKLGTLFSFHPLHISNFNKPQKSHLEDGPAEADSFESVPDESSGDEPNLDSSDEEDEASPVTLAFDPQGAAALGNLLRQQSGSMSLAKRYLQLTPSYLNFNFQIQHSRLIEEFLKEQDLTKIMEDGPRLCLTLKRMNAKADEFCNQFHKQLHSI